MRVSDPLPAVGDNFSNEFVTETLSPLGAKGRLQECILSAYDNGSSPEPRLRDYVVKSVMQSIGKQK